LASRLSQGANISLSCTVLPINVCFLPDGILLIYTLLTSVIYVI
jgi:hypothetical protein